MILKINLRVITSWRSRFELFIRVCSPLIM